MIETDVSETSFIDVWRGPLVESSHSIAACACDAEGNISYASGTVDVPVYLRSSAKPFIAAAIVSSGAADRFGFDSRQLAVMAASHAGEPGHVEAVASILELIGAGEEDLRCGAQGPETTSLQHNCSGKHAGILALSRMLGAPLQTYLHVDHPAQKFILSFYSRVFQERIRNDRIGIDGCGIPVIAFTLRQVAAAFARFATLDRLALDDRNALAVVRSAMLAHPWYVGGTHRFDTDLMTAANDTYVSKSGAEGVQAIGLIKAKLGLALKVVDGSARAAAPAALAALAKMNALDSQVQNAMVSHSRIAVKDHAGLSVGYIAARGL